MRATGGTDPRRFRVSRSSYTQVDDQAELATARAAMGGWDEATQKADGGWMVRGDAEVAKGRREDEDKRRKEIKRRN